jgi:hypothetical protein
MTFLILIGEVREDDSVYITSPQVPLFHIVAPDKEDWNFWCMPILEEMLKRNLNKEYELIEWTAGVFEKMDPYLLCAVYSIYDKKE